MIHSIVRAFCIAACLLGVPSIHGALVGFWNFDDSTLLGRDVGGNNYNLTVSVGATYSAAGKRGGAALFNGSNGYMLGTLPLLPVGNGAYTISSWFLPTATGTRGIVGWGNYGQTRKVIALRLNGTNGLKHYWWNADLDGTPAASYSDGQWHHIAAVYDGTTRSMYLDGVLLAQDTPGANTATNLNFRIASTNAGEFFKGSLDEVAIWNNALTVNEIQALAAGAAPVGGPRITSFTATPPAAYEGAPVQLSWVVDISQVTGSYSYELKYGTTILATGATANGNFGVTVPDLAGTAQNISYTLRAIETGGGRITNVAVTSVAGDPGRPIANDQLFLSTAGPTPLPIVLSGSDPNGGTLSFSIVAPPTHGTLTGAPPNMTYIADSGAIGPDSFTFKANDGKYESGIATVAITINAPPSPPSTIVLDQTSVPDSTPANGFIANLSSPDPNPDEAHTFTLVGGEGSTNNGLFLISGHQLRAAQPFAGLAGQVVSLRLRSTDALGLFVERAVSLPVVAVVGGVVINEIHFNGADNTVLNDFVELYNSGQVPVNLTGWRISGGVDYAFPNNTIIAAGGYLLIAEAPSVILSKFSKTALGPWTGSLNSDGESVRLRNAADAVVDSVDYSVGFPWPVASGGDGASLERINARLEGTLGGNWRASTIPPDGTLIDTASPGAQNLKYGVNAPPAVRQVAHSPQQPTTANAITFTAKVTDPDGVATVTLSYQIVTPGNYIPSYLPNPISGNNIASEIRTANPAFEAPANWTTVTMNDDGISGDALGGDSIWTVKLPPQANRTLLRYRITVTDNTGSNVRVPYADDPSLNFACYIYNGVPAYQGTPAATLGSLPTYQLITRGADWSDCVAYSTTKQINQGNLARFFYNWNGTFVYEGVVYDHVKYRTRGGNGRYTGSGKRSMRFKFNRGAYLAIRDQDGNFYPTKWQTLTTSKGLENHAAITYSLNEFVNNRLWNAYGVPSPFTHFAHWRNVTTAAEQSDAYHGDFQGFIGILEDYDARFFDAHNLPKGNLYKLLNQTNVALEQQRYQAPLGAKNGTDHDWIESSLTGFTPPATVAANVNLDKFDRYHAICQAVRHYDYWPDANKNMAYYFEPDYTAANGFRGKLWILPFDTDASWGPNWNNGQDVVYNALFSCSDGGGDAGTNPTLWPAYFNAVREVRDLIFQPDQINPLLDEAAAVIAPIVAADTARWKTATADVGSYAGLSGPGSTSLAALVQDMKNFAFSGGAWPGGSVGAGGRAAFLDTLQASQGEGLLIPNTPTISFTGGAGYAVNDLRFLASAFADPQGAGTFGTLQWRVAEITDPAAPAYVPGSKLKLEIEAGYQSDEITTYAAGFRFPAVACIAGHTYRARVRMKDNTGRWSHWSAPVQFTATSASVAPYQQSLVISEIMYHPTPATAAETAQGWTDDDFEYVEIRNVSAQPVDVTDVRFTKGIDFDFPAGTTIAAGSSVLVVRNAAAFAARYGPGKPVVGTWVTGDFLSNGGEQVKLSFGAGTQITSVTYDDTLPWPGSADGGGYSLVRIAPENLALNPDFASNWRTSRQSGGTPGGDDRTTFNAWATMHGVPAEPLADPDRDGLPNLAEYVLIGDPLAGSEAVQPTPVVARLSVGGVDDDYLTLIVRRMDLPSDIGATVEFSTDLVNWSLPGVLISTSANADGTVTETWRAPQPQSGSVQLFGRLKMSLP